MAQPLTDAAQERSGRRPRRPEGRREQSELVEALLERDEQACREFLLANYTAMVRVARCYVGTRAIAEEVVQEAWMAMFRGLERFEHRSSIRTWLFGILIRRARSVGARERRTQAVSQLVGAEDELSPDPIESLFHADGHPDAGGWAMPPARWRTSPESEALSAEMRSIISRAIDGLPETQRIVITLRDVEGWETAEIARLLDKTRNAVRVALHRGRLKVRAAIDRKLGAQE